MANYAVVENGTVINMIVIEDTSFIAHYQSANPAYSCIDTAGIAPAPGIGWSYTTAGGFTAPPTPASLVANPARIPPDGTTASTVTWTATEGATAPAQVTFDINGTPKTVNTANNQAAVEVTSTTAGETITVTCEGLTATVTVS
jgi:hypothetical protein